MQDWIYCVNPTLASAGGEPETKEYVRELAVTRPEMVLCLAARRYMEPGDRIWIYFATPVKEIAALTVVAAVPKEEPGDARYPWKVSTVLNAKATGALYDRPVPLAALANQHPQGVIRAKPADVPLLEAHAELLREPGQRGPAGVERGRHGRLSP